MLGCRLESEEELVSRAGRGNAAGLLICRDRALVSETESEKRSIRTKEGAKGACRLNQQEEIGAGGAAEIERLIQYKALPSQRRFLDLTARFKGFSGPVGSGKSAALCFEGLRLAHKNPGRVGLIGAPTYGMLRDVTMRAFTEQCRDLGVAYTMNKAQHALRFTESGSQVLFRSMDAAERLRGSNLAWFGIDELTYCGEDAWLRLEARLRDPQATRLSGFAVWTPKGFDWVYQRFRARPVDGYGLVEARPFENRHLLEATPDYYERLKASYDERFYEQEVLGEYRSLSAGRVYYAFERESNVGELSVDETRPLLWSWDFNVSPMVSVVAQRDGDELHIVDEIVLRTASTVEACEEFERRYGAHRAGLQVYGDASARSRNTASRHSDYELIRDFLARRPEWRGELLIGRSNPPVRDRVNLTNGWLRSAGGDARLRIGATCRRLIEDLERVVYKPDSGVVDKSDAARTHLSDALGYLLWAEERAERQVGEQGRPLL